MLGQGTRLDSRDAYRLSPNSSAARKVTDSTGFQALTLVLNAQTKPTSAAPHAAPPPHIPTT